MRHILLTWNPGPANDEQYTPEQWERKMVARTADGKTLASRWSCGNRVQGIEPGDRAYMLRQGVHGRGLVAVGVIDSEPFSDLSWRYEDELAQYVYVTWEEAVPLEDRIDIEVLKQEVPGFKWDSVYSSGRDVSAHGATLEALWFGQANDSAPLPAILQGAGFGTAEQNRRVERAAIQIVTHAYEVEGYNVSSVEAAKCGWDLTAVRGDHEVHVEVKGAAGSLVRFFLTANEYRAASEDPEWLLVVITNALGDAEWWEMDGPFATSYATPAVYQVRVPAEELVTLDTSLSGTKD